MCDVSYDECCVVLVNEFILVHSIIWSRCPFGMWLTWTPRGIPSWLERTQTIRPTRYVYTCMRPCGRPAARRLRSVHRDGPLLHVRHATPLPRQPRHLLPSSRCARVRFARTEICSTGSARTWAQWIAEIFILRVTGTRRWWNGSTSGLPTLCRTCTSSIGTSCFKRPCVFHVWLYYTWWLPKDYIVLRRVY